MKYEVNFLTLIALLSLVILEVVPENSPSLLDGISLSEADAEEYRLTENVYDDNLINFPLSSINLAGTNIEAGFGNDSNYYLKIIKPDEQLTASSNKQYSLFEIGGEIQRKIILLSDGFSKEDFISRNKKAVSLNALNDNTKFKEISLNPFREDTIFLKANDKILAENGSSFIAEKDKLTIDFINPSGESKKFKIKLSSLGLSLMENDSLFSVGESGVQVSLNNKTIKF